MGIGLDLQDNARREEFLNRLENGMNQNFNTVVVSKTELLAKVKENLTKHEQEYNAAVKIWREETIQKMRDNLKKAEESGEIETYIVAPVPVNYSKEYNKAIKKLEMHQMDLVHLSDHEFENFVMDEWEWSRNFVNNTRSYSAKAIHR